MLISTYLPTSHSQQSHHVFHEHLLRLICLLWLSTFTFTEPELCCTLFRPAQPLSLYPIFLIVGEIPHKSTAGAYATQLRQAGATCLTYQRHGLRRPVATWAIPSAHAAMLTSSHAQLQPPLTSSHAQPQPHSTAAMLTTTGDKPLVDSPGCVSVMRCLGVHPDPGFRFGVGVPESGVGLDRASASGSLRRLDFRVRYLVIGGGRVVGRDGEAVDSDEGDRHK